METIEKLLQMFVFLQTFSRHNIKQAFCLWLNENVRLHGNTPQGGNIEQPRATPWE